MSYIAYRAMRLVRSLAPEYRLDTGRIGILGFSAGGEVVATVAYSPGIGDPKAADAPPAFLIAADDDECCSPPVVQLLERYRAAKVPVEAHILAHGNHAFNMGYRSDLRSVKSWPQRLADCRTTIF